MTTIYFMRHQEVLKPKNLYNTDSLQLQNEKWTITAKGEAAAKKKSELEEFNHFNVVYSSNYVRAIATAKYFSEDFIIDERFGERRFGIKKWDDLPEDLWEKQFADLNYKLEGGESMNDVARREKEALDEILLKHQGEKVLVVGHSTALAVLFSLWCNIAFQKPYTFNGDEFFDGIWNFGEVFKLEFNGNNLVSIKNLK